ncbi:hypothetical protein [Rossellomorea marisflavi]|uniref:hypothetical protein n=1 Tax=Rossellomorea marisflavi TaxID=189381 RepID=UPI00295ED104|nr:hypothetical protein [Rossellomorea marisflavi]
MSARCLTITFLLGLEERRGAPFRCGRPLSCGVDGEPFQLRLQGLTSPLFPRESAVLRCTALHYADLDECPLSANPPFY